ncbi:hypothetical protein L1987_78770 [Smallanthus sonchifolius]|uniref:Uncharacterized protein n=1 Tax=Smallanthus sonchifolius TaxID=185202 RepID=A0ACB8ZI27_9ASTR|nr:hypothetical protein L1987_78770 [Smallanthus sonchifolius]
MSLFLSVVSLNHGCSPVASLDPSLVVVSSYFIPFDISSAGILSLLSHPSWATSVTSVPLSLLVQSLRLVLKLFIFWIILGLFPCL